MQNGISLPVVTVIPQMLEKIWRETELKFILSEQLMCLCSSLENIQSNYKLKIYIYELLIKIQ